MKKCFTLLSVLLAFGLTANAETEKLILAADGGARVIDPNAKTQPNGLPAQVTIPGNWGDVKIYNGSLDATTYVGCSVTLAEAPAEETVQVYYRNADQAAAYSGTYVQWKSSENAVLSEDGRTLTITFSSDALGEDLTITELALQNMTSNSVTVVIEDVSIIDEDENVIPTNGLKATGWNPATITEIKPQLYEADVVWSQVGGYLGMYSGTVEEGTYHKVTFHTTDPLPEGFDAFCRNGSYSDPDKVYMKREGKGTNAFSVSIPATYERLYLTYGGDAEMPLTVHFTSVEREVITGTLTDVEIEYPTKEPLQLISDNGAEIVNPNITTETNGLPALVSIPGNWGDVKLYDGSFDAATYVACRVSLREAPQNGEVHVYYRNAEQAAAYSGTYVEWAAAEGVELLDGGKTLSFTFDADALGEDLTITELALQNTTGSAVPVVIEHVYLIDEDENVVSTNGLKATGWNPATITSLAATATDPVFAGYVSWSAADCWLGAYSADVAAGTYHRYTFITDSPLADDVKVICRKGETPVSVIEEGRGTDTLVIYINEPYDVLALQGTAADGQVYVKSVLREAFIGQYTSALHSLNDARTTVCAQIFNISGVRVANPQSGLCIVRRIMSDGSARTGKVIYR
ncbi:MAG: hypothetical protein K6E86_09380 [Bacteroidales bacterium]|nr:hypothetical protein [Bacteroidales bacterium]